MITRLCIFSAIILGGNLSASGQTYDAKHPSVLLVQQQLEGYNSRNIELFLEPYSDTVKVYEFSNELKYSGKDLMRKRYAEMFSKLPDLHCTLVNRMHLNNIVIDQEYVIKEKGKEPVQVFALYKIKNNKIDEVHFIRPGG